MRIKSMRGHEVDFSVYIAQNESKVAIGNAKMNSRGDIVAPNGTVLASREATTMAYHNTNKRAVKNVSLKNLAGEVLMTPAQAMAASRPAPKRKISDTDTE